MNFNDFTKKSQVIKSARFELIPCGATRAYLEKHNVIENDTKRKNNVFLVKEISDDFIKEFLTIIGNSVYDWTSLESAFGTLEYRSAAERVKTEIASDITAKFIAYMAERADEYGIEKVAWPSAGFVEDLLPAYANKTEKFCKTKYKDAFVSLKNASTALFKGNFAKYDFIISSTKKGSVADRVLENFEIFEYNKALLRKYGERLSLTNKYECMTGEAGTCMNNFISQSGIDRYNNLIGAEYNESGECITEGLNQIINKYNQKNPDSKIPYLKQMHKQILIDVAPAFTIETIEDAAALKLSLDAMHELYTDIEEGVGKLVNNIGKAYLCKDIYITNVCKRNISNALCGEWKYIENIQKFSAAEKLKKEYLELNGREKKNLTKKDEGFIQKTIKSQPISVSEVNDILSGTETTNTEGYFSNLYSECRNDVSSAYKKMLNCKFWTAKAKPQWEENATVQKYIDSALAMANIVSNFVTDATKVDCNVDMIEQVEILHAKRKELNKLYNLIRNYLTKKPEQDAKKASAQLMFGRPNHLQQTWNNKQVGKFGNPDMAILEYDGIFYYMVSAAAEQKLGIPLIEKEGRDSRTDYYNYLSTKKCIKLSMGLPKQTFSSKKALGFYKTAASDDEKFEIPVGESTMIVTRRMYDNYNAKTFRTDEKAKIALIDFAKEFLSKDSSFKVYDFSSLKPSCEYATYGEFCNDVDAIAFRVACKYISKTAVDEGVERGKLYLFKISNQDMYKPRERCKDKTSLRFRAVIERMFDGDNSIIINNAPQIMYRPAIIERKDMHPMGSILVNKLTSDGRKIPDDIYKEIYRYVNHRLDELSEEAKSYMSKIVTKESTREHIKDKHYSREMFTITISYTINKTATNPVTAYALNKEVLDKMKTQDFNIMTVIRGTDNLLYYYVCDSSGMRIEAGDLNTVGGVNYLERLTVLGKERHTRQDRWDYSMENKVAEIKDTYLGQACNEIIRIAIRNNAVIVVDVISDKMKTMASFFDNKLYKKFEDKLVKALSDYTNVQLDDRAPGGMVNPLQLATGENLKGWQNGIVFFTTTAMTKNVCPETGFVNVLDTKNICTLNAKRKCLEAMNAIRFDKNECIFEFIFSFDKIGSYFSQEEQPGNINKVWSVKTFGTRVVRDNKYARKTLNGTAELSDYLKSENISVDKDVNVQQLNDIGIKLFFDVFNAYINGYAEKSDGESVYISPITGWRNDGIVAYDEMTAQRISQKAGHMIDRMLDGARGTDAALSKVEWYEMLTNEK